MKNGRNGDEKERKGRVAGGRKMTRQQVPKRARPGLVASLGRTPAASATRPMLACLVSYALYKRLYHPQNFLVRPVIAPSGRSLSFIV
jgi:hypothetical protein